MGDFSEEKLLNRTAPVSVTPNLQEQRSFDSEKQEHLSPTSPTSDYDPCALAKPCSPFYLYKHDSPRPSTDQSQLKVPASGIHVSVQDLEVGNLTPTATNQEKRKSSENGVLRLWPTRKQCMTKPKDGVRQRFRRLPRWKRLSIEMFIALLIIGAIVGVAVGISIKVHGGVYKSANQQAPIPS